MERSNHSAGVRATDFRPECARGLKPRAGSIPSTDAHGRAHPRRRPGLMRAITVIPGQAGSAALEDVPEPDEAAGSLLVEGLAVGIGGADGEIVRGEYGWAPPGARRLVLGHESLGRVREAPEGSGFA